ALLGRCHELADAPALWPWGQAIEGLLGSAAGHGVDPEARALLGAIAESVPAIRAWLEQTRAVTRIEPSVARFRLFHSVAQFLGALARYQPVLVVLEDVHAADPDSLRLIDFVARHEEGQAVGIVASHRDGERNDCLTELLGNLPGAPGYEDLL